MREKPGTQERTPPPPSNHQTPRLQNSQFAENIREISAKGHRQDPRTHARALERNRKINRINIVPADPPATGYRGYRLGYRQGEESRVGGGGGVRSRGQEAEAAEREQASLCNKHISCGVSLTLFWAARGQVGHSALCIVPAHATASSSQRLGPGASLLMLLLLLLLLMLLLLLLLKLLILVFLLLVLLMLVSLLLHLLLPSFLLLLIFLFHSFSLLLLLLLLLLFLFHHILLSLLLNSYFVATSLSPLPPPPPPLPTSASTTTTTPTHSFCGSEEYTGKVDC